jgi:retron-type reverse transcriptase
MKRYNNLYPQITDFSNLVLAARQAQRGKRFRENVLKFNYNLEAELAKIKSELESKTYQPGRYKTFDICEPKPRLISAAPYRDRVIHHALCNIIVPIFENTFIADSYANRLGFGTHKALHRFTSFARDSRYILQCDIKKYFPSIDHEILKSLLRRKLKCHDTLWLAETIINSSNPQVPVIDHFPGDDLLSPLQHRRGLPIGNLSSQFFANVYLNSLDHFIKEQLKAKKYVRYVDDFALFSDDYEFLAQAQIAIEKFLVSLRLKLHPVKSQLYETRHGANFLGFRILPDRIRVRSENLRRGRRRLHQLQRDYAQGKINFQDVHCSILSWQAHLAHSDSWQLRQKIFASLVFTRE